MATFKATRDLDPFLNNFIVPFQGYVADLDRNSRTVEANYLSAQVVAFAMKLGVLHEVLDFVDSSAQPGQGADPIHLAGQAAKQFAQYGPFDRNLLPAACNIVNLGQYLDLDPDVHGQIYEPAKFRLLGPDIISKVVNAPAEMPIDVRACALASTAQIAATSGNEPLQKQALQHLTTDPEFRTYYLLAHGDVPDYRKMGSFAIDLPRASRMARKWGDLDSAVAFDLFANPAKPGLLTDAGLSKTDPAFRAARRYADTGNIGIASLLDDAAIYNADKTKADFIGVLSDMPSHDTGTAVTPRRIRTVTGRALPNPVRTAEASAGQTAAAPKAPLQPAGRSLNAWIDSERPEVDKPFNVDVMIGRKAADADMSGSFPEPDWGDLTKLDLLITIVGVDCSVSPASFPVELPRTGSTPRVRFAVTPRGSGEQMLTICVFLRTQMLLLQSYDFVVDVAAVQTPVAA